MGRRKISIQPITDERNRKVTFVKRKAGLFKKAHELAVLCQVDIAVIILGKNHSKFFEYTSTDVDQLLDRFKNEGVAHDVKTPEDYGDYKTMSRVGPMGADKGHRRTTSVMTADVVEGSDDEEEDEDGDDDNEEKPAESKRKLKGQNTDRPAKQRKTTSRKKAKDEVTVKPEVSVLEQRVQQLQDINSLNTVPASNQSAMVGSQLPNQLLPRYTQSHLPLSGQVSGLPMHNPLYEGSYSHFQESQQRMMPHPWSQQQQQQQQQLPVVETVPPSQASQLAYQYRVSGNYVPQQHLQSPPSTGGGLPQPVVINSPYTRARSLNNNISKRPILRVEIPTDARKQKDGITTTSTTSHTGLHTDESANKTGGSGKDGTMKPGEKTPTSAQSDEPKGLGLLSNGSTPLSASLGSGLFNLPPPLPPQQSKMGEQTPLTGGLPSRYVPDLFPSPSNFYSNDWNIPFGSGNTPIPSSANHQLPPRVRRHLQQNLTDSPLQTATIRRDREQNSSQDQEFKESQSSKNGNNNGDSKSK